MTPSHAVDVQRSLEIGAGPWAGVLLGVLVVAALFAVKRLHRLESAAIDRGRRARWLASALRLCAIALALALLARPAIRSIEVEPVRPKVEILVDRSASMGTGAVETARAIDASLGASRDVAVVPFETEPGEAVDASAARLDGQSGAAIVLVTDARGFRGDGPRTVPLLAVPLPTAAARLALLSPDSPARCLRGDPLNVSVRLATVGAAGREIEIDVRDRADDRTLASRRVTPTGDRFDERVGVTAAGLGPGLHVLSIVATASGEPALDDRVDVAVDVVDEKLRVLYVDGQPRWTYRFLKAALLRDPAVTAYCLLLSADRDFPQEASPGERPLATFPAWEDLQKLDVVVLGDVDPAKLEPTALADLRRFVEERGGGLAFLAGPLGAPGKLAATPLEDVLPVALPAASDGKPWVASDPFAFRLSDAGRASSILRFFPDEARNVAYLEGRSEPEAERPPGFTGHAAVREAKPGATVLAEHPGDGAPLLATQWFGTGRALFVGVDELWRWRFGAEDLVFYRFFGQAIRFLADVDRLAGESAGRAIPDRAEVRPGETLRLVWRGADPPESLEIAGPAAARVRLQGGEASLVASAPGLYVVRPGGGARESAFRVADPPRERLAEPDVDALRRAAESSGGALVSPDDVASIPAKLPRSAAARRIDRGVEPLVSSAATFWIVVAVLAIEWTIRKWLRLA
jgi:hypothetical protein